MIQLQPSLFSALSAGGKTNIIGALKKALALEHSTIPLYLYAYYSLDTSKNGVIAKTIFFVVKEEMLHMSLVCNILNALGCSPRLDPPDVIPAYPGPLPGGVEAQLKVHLAPYSGAQLCTFLTIESPDEPIEFPVALAAAAPRPTTIGDYYREIRRHISNLADGDFTGDPALQFGPGSAATMRGAIRVTDKASALKAIDEIVMQGEGTTQSPLEAMNSGVFAHYYRFAEIAHSRMLIKNPNANAKTPVDKQYLYGGAVINFDPTGVYAVPTDPKATDYPDGSAAAKANNEVNSTYTLMLKSLHQVFNGHLGEFANSEHLMRLLGGHASDMMSGSSTGGVPAGPSFEWHP